MGVLTTHFDCSLNDKTPSMGALEGGSKVRKIKTAMHNSRYKSHIIEYTEMKTNDTKVAAPKATQMTKDKSK